MGCHVWFFRPMTDEEFEKMKAEAYNHALEVGKKCLQDGCLSQNFFSYTLPSLKKSIEENIPCVEEKFYWFELGWGWKDNHTLVECINGKMYVEVDGFFDVARCIYTYPKKKIYSYKQYKRYVGKKWYTDVTDEDKRMLREFFNKYPKGCICFG